MEICVGPGGVQPLPHQSPQWLPRRTPEIVVVVELFVAVQMYVLLTPAVSDAFVDDSVSVISPSDEVVDCKTTGAA
jgi:hypothetical protein